MIAIEVFQGLLGGWRATNRLWLSPDDPVRESESLDGKPQEDRIIVGQDPGSHAVKAVWFDSSHMRNDFMTCQGGVDAQHSAWRPERAGRGGKLFAGSRGERGNMSLVVHAEGNIFGMMEEEAG
jgi:hypothetical protein